MQSYDLCWGAGAASFSVKEAEPETPFSLMEAEPEPHQNRKFFEFCATNLFGKPKGRSPQSAAQLVIEFLRIETLEYWYRV
jgi:hypothetical protein